MLKTIAALTLKDSSNYYGGEILEATQRQYGLKKHLSQHSEVYKTYLRDFQQKPDIYSFQTDSTTVKDWVLCSVRDDGAVFAKMPEVRNTNETMAFFINNVRFILTRRSLGFSKDGTKVVSNANKDSEKGWWIYIEIYAGHFMLLRYLSDRYTKGEHVGILFGTYWQFFEWKTTGLMCKEPQTIIEMLKRDEYWGRGLSAIQLRGYKTISKVVSTMYGKEK